MDHDLELVSPILEILEMEVSNILYNPRNIGKRSFSTSSYPGNIGNLSLDWGYVGMCLQPLFCCGTTPQGLFLCQEQHFCNFRTCPLSGNNTFPWFWSLFGSIWALLNIIEPYWALLEPYWSLIGALLSPNEPYWALLSLNSQTIAWHRRSQQRTPNISRSGNPSCWQRFDFDLFMS